MVTVSATVSVSAVTVAAAACMSKRHDTRERVDCCGLQNLENKIEKCLSSSCDAQNFVSANNNTTKDAKEEEKEEEEKEVMVAAAAVAAEEEKVEPIAVVAGERDEQSVRRNEIWTAADNCQNARKTTEASSRSGCVVEASSVADKFSVDFEKWFKTRAEPTSMDLDAKVAEDVDRYLGAEGALSPHVFLGKDPYGLSIDIDLAKKADLNLPGYDPILQDELPNEKVDDEYTLSEFQLYHLDPLTLSPDDMMVAGEILPSISGQLTLNAEQEDVVETRIGVVSRTGLRNGDKTIDGKSVQAAVNESRVTDPSAKDRTGKTKSENEAEGVKDRSESQQLAAVAQPSVNIADHFTGVLASVAANSSNAMAQVQRQGISSPGVPGAIMEQLKLKTRVKLEPRIIKKRRKIQSERLEKRLDRHGGLYNNGKSFVRDDDAGVQQDDVMAMVAISTDKTSNTTQIVISTGTERQVYQGKTSELIEATGNFPMLPKIDTSVMVWNGTSNVECNGHDSSNPGSSQYEIVISKALEELGITDDNLQPVCLTEHDKVWLCPQDDCNRQFGRLYTLKGHLLAHYGVRPFKVRRKIVVLSLLISRSIQQSCVIMIKKKQRT